MRTKEFIRLKYLAALEMGQSPPSTEYSLSSNIGLPFLQGTADFGSTYPEPRVYCATPTKVALLQDILFSIRAPVGELNIANREFGIGRGLCAIRCKQYLDRQFTWWALHYTRQQLAYAATGSTYDAVAIEDVANLVLPFYPITEQRAVADYLNRETNRLDALIAAKERLLNLLAEKRRAVITHVITRGLNPDASLRDSMVEWIGKIPAGWEMKRLRYIAHLKSGESITAEQITENKEFPVYGGNGLRGYTDSFTHDGYYVLIGRQGALCGNINYAEGRFWASEHAVVVTPRIPVETLWLGELLRTMNLNQYSVSAAQPGLAIDRINLLQLPFPPLEEQRAIVDYLIQHIQKIDRLAKLAQDTINLLHERRAALIAATVSGQIEVV